MKSITHRMAMGVALVVHVATADELKASTPPEIVQWNESVVADLGRGFNPYQPATFGVLRPPIADLGNPVTSGVSGGGITSYFVRSKEDIVRYLDINLAASVNSIAYDGDIRLRFTDSYSSSEDTVTLLTKARRNFGQVIRPTLGMTDSFRSEVLLMQKSLTGQSLYAAISNKFGGHYISGYRHSAQLSILYKFKFSSKWYADEFSSTLNVESPFVDINAAVRRAFSGSSSGISIEYNLENFGRGAPPTLWPTNVIRSPEDFLEFGKRVEEYWAGLTESDGVPTEYFAEPIGNIPGFSELVNAYSPTNQIPGPYEQFLNVHGKLKRWQNTLRFWSGSDDRMSWMNAEGRAMTRSLELDCDRELKALQRRARDHFELGLPLVVNDATLALEQNFDRIPRPRFGNLVSSDFCGSTTICGYILCGHKDFVPLRPFSSLSVLVNDATVYASTIYTMNEWESIVSGPFNGCNVLVEWGRGTIGTHLWQELRDADCQVLIYMIGDLRNQGWGPLENVSLALKDNAGNVVTSVPILNTDRPRCTTFDGQIMDADIALIDAARDTVGFFDSRLSSKLIVTNSGPRGVYGVYANIPIPFGMSLLSMFGSQGELVLTNGSPVIDERGVLFHIGSIGFRGASDININLVPHSTGTLTTKLAMATGVGVGLVDTNLRNNSVALGPVSVTTASLTAIPISQGVGLTWESVTGRLFLERSSSLEDDSSWGAVSEDVQVQGDIRHLQLPVTSAMEFFRLQNRSN